MNAASPVSAREQQIRISHPRNRFGLEDATKYILVAGGIGVTPLVAMAHHLLAEDARFELHVYARDSAHTPLADVLGEQGLRDHVHIHLSSDGDSITVAPHERIADVLVGAGVEIEMSCEQGMCGACLTGVLAGIPDHRDDMQSDAERASNTHLTVCCSRSRTSALVLDL